MDKKFFIPLRELKLDCNEESFGLEAYITDKNINANSSYEYYCYLGQSKQEFGPFISPLNLAIGDRFKVILPQKMNDLQELSS